MEASMPQESPRQRKTTGRVMHEFAHGELKSGPGGKGGKAGASCAQGHPTKAQLYKEAQARHIEGRSRMSKRELENALR
jgi:hypothetical protein